jgi:ribonuclease PH
LTSRERPADELRHVRITQGYTDMTPGSVLIEMGRTRVLCTASIEAEVPRWMRGGDTWWVTAEYGMLPGSSPERIRRDNYTGGRAKEISRLIGRALRSVVDLSAMPEMMMRVDCDVLQADGGTRTAAVTGAWIAMHDAFSEAVAKGRLGANPIHDFLAAISVGNVAGDVLLDLEYVDDVAADVDMNVVMTGRGLLVEVQGTAEGAPFTRDELDAMLDIAAKGIDELFSLQKQAVAP